MSDIVLIIEELFVLLFHLLTRLEVLLSENYKQNLLKALWSANNKTKSWNAALTHALVIFEVCEIYSGYFDSTWNVFGT